MILVRLLWVFLGGAVGMVAIHAVRINGANSGELFALSCLLGGLSAVLLFLGSSK